MPPQKKMSSLVAKIGAMGHKAHEQHKADETSYGIINLPAGISGGIARLDTVKWDEYKSGKNQGKPYVMFRGIAILPAEHKGIKVEGQGVMIMLPLCETTKNTKDGVQTVPFEDNYANLLNEFRKFGIDTSQTSFDDLDNILAHLNTEKPHYRFSTRGYTPPKTAQNPNPTEIVYTQFDGACEFVDENADPAAGFQDSTSDPKASAAPITEGFDETQGSNAGGGDSSSQENNAEGSGEEIAELVKVATGKDAKAAEKASDRLAAIALEAGVSQEEVEGATSWEQVGEMILAKQSESGEETPEASNDPAVGDIWKYQVIDPKTKKPVMDTKKKRPKDPIEVEITAINEAKKTASIKDTGNAKATWANVPWDQLLPLSE